VDGDSAEREIREIEKQFASAGKHLQFLDEDDGTFTAFYSSAPIAGNTFAQGASNFNRPTRLEAARAARAALESGDG
jgi:hypothetical protein